MSCSATTVVLRESRRLPFAVTAGAQAAAGLLSVGLAAGYMPHISPTLVVDILLFVQWQMLGLTLVKFGLDQFAFASVARSPIIGFRLPPVSVRLFIPAALGYAVVAFSAFPAIPCILMGAAIVADACALIRSAEASARSNYWVAAIAAWLNYPLFFLLLVGVALTVDLSLAAAAFLFLISSLVRLALVLGLSCEQSAVEWRKFKLSPMLGLQQGGNYWLFRADQVLLAVLLPNLIGTVWLSTDRSAEFIFMAKLPELASSAFVLLGAFVFPTNFLRCQRTAWLDLVRLILEYRWKSLAVILTGACTVVVYALVYRGPAIDAVMLPGFFFSLLLILPANLLTFSMMRRGCFAAMIKNQVLAALMGAALLSMCVLFGQDVFLLLPWLVPLQLSAYLALGLYLPWGKSEVMYA